MAVSWISKSEIKWLPINLCVQMSRLFLQPDGALLRADVQPAPEPVHGSHQNQREGRRGSAVLHRRDFYERCVVVRCLILRLPSSWRSMFRKGLQFPSYIKLCTRVASSVGHYGSREAIPVPFSVSNGICPFLQPCTMPARTSKPLPAIPKPWTCCVERLQASATPPTGSSICLTSKMDSLRFL